MKKIIYDIETLLGMYLFMAYDEDTDKWYQFEISKRKNDLYAFVKFLEEFRDYWFVGYNNLDFDGQIIHYIKTKFKNWYDLDNLEIVKRIYQKAQDVIDDTNNGIFPPYREEDLYNKQLDLFKIHHFNNKHRRVSLKWLEFMMNMPSLEEMPIHHSKLKFTNEELDEIIAYCKNDIESTYRFYLYTVGETDHSFYTGENKIQDRIDLVEELGPKVINFSDVKIGDEINKQGYISLTGLNFKEIMKRKRNRRSTKGFTFGECIPNYVSFQTIDFQNFYNGVKDEKVNLNSSKQEFNFTYRGTKYTIARGGIHSCEKNRIITAKPGEILRDADIGSQYPNAIRKRKLFPSHLGVKWLQHYTNTIVERIKYKKLGKDDPKAMSKAKGLKLSLNGGGLTS